jgi:KAP family P-loop domain
MNVSDTSKPSGFDAAIKRQEDDHLKRWPFAREIYGITVTGPPEWSVRVGIYGEWGTGKTSVLEFIAGMAERDGHTLVRFNPWQCATKDALWRGFVTAIYNQPIFYSMERAGWVRIKKKSRWFLGQGKVVEAGTKILNDTAGQAVGVGLDIAKGWFSFSKDDLAAVRKKLGDKRVIVLIDDLDRTAPELVPEILFALKELMDVPQFSFVCAFDPTVVGQVLGTFHPGFGDGLKFLEKIIDYPRWLPPPPADGLLNLAIADSKNFAPYVPEQALRDVVPLLPPNPRAIRQFIRLLALLRPQVERHYPSELRWPVILTANAIKVRYPQLASGLLTTRAFWTKLHVSTFGASRSGDDAPEKKDLLLKHIDEVASKHGVELQNDQKEEIQSLLEKLCSAQNIMLWINADNLSYQLSIAEAPHAVTWKEFDELIAEWGKNEKTETIQAWIQTHVKRVSRLPVEIYTELFQATVTRYAQLLHDGDTTLTNTNQAALIASATSVLNLLNALTSGLLQSGLHPGCLDAAALEFAFDKFASVVRGTGRVHSNFCAQNENYLPSLLANWQGDITPLVKVLHPYRHYPPHSFDQGPARDLYKKLRASLLSKLAQQVVRDLAEPDFGTRVFSEESDTHEIRQLLLSPQSPLWTECKVQALSVLKEASSKPEIQENAYELLHLFDYKLREESGSSDGQAVKSLLAQKDIREAIWGAATATPLSALAAGRLQRLAKTMAAQGNTLPYPAWWDETIKSATAAYGSLEQESPPPEPGEDKKPAA